MANTLNDAAGNPVAAVLDGGECAIAMGVFSAALKGGHVGAADLRAFPPSVQRVFAVLERVARFSMSANGQTADPPTRALAATGHGLPLDHAGDDIVGVMETADLLSVSERQARRVLERIGTKVGGRRIAHRADIEREVASK